MKFGEGRKGRRPGESYVSKFVLHRSAYFSSVSMTIFKSDLDLHLSDSDWCGLVVRFWLSYLNENRFPNKRGLGTKIGLKF